MTTSRMPENCIGCDALLRPKNSVAREHPGTRQYAALDLCSKCYRRKLAGNPTEQEMIKFSTVDPKTARDRANLDAFLHQIGAKRRQYEQRAKVRMVTR